MFIFRLVISRGPSVNFRRFLTSRLDIGSLITRSNISESFSEAEILRKRLTIDWYLRQYPSKKCEKVLPTQTTRGATMQRLSHDSTLVTHSSKNIPIVTLEC